MQSGLRGIFIGGTIVVLAVLSFVAYSVDSSEEEAPSREVKIGDSLGVHLTFYDSSGTIMLSTNPELADELEEVQSNYDGQFILAESGGPITYVVPESIAPLRWGNATTIPLGHSLVGKTIGQGAIVPVIGQMPAYTQAISIERLRGPFNWTMDTTIQALENFTRFVAEDTVAIDDLLTGIIEETNGDSVRLRLQLDDGDVLPIRRTAINATVMANNESTFQLMLDAEPDAEFSLHRTCAFARYVLDPGTYRLSDSNESSLTFERSPTRFPQMMEKDLTVAVEIAEFVDDEKPS